MSSQGGCVRIEGCVRTWFGGRALHVASCVVVVGFVRGFGVPLVGACGLAPSLFARRCATCTATALPSFGVRGVWGVPCFLRLWLELALWCGAGVLIIISYLRLSVSSFALVPCPFSGCSAGCGTEFAAFIVASICPVCVRRQLSGLLLVVHGRRPVPLRDCCRCTVLSGGLC